MLEKIDFTAEHMKKKEYKALKDDLISKLVILQQEAHTHNVGLVCLVDGPAGSGRGTLISDLICRLDPRYTSVVITPQYDHDQMLDLKHLGGCDGMSPYLTWAWRGLRARNEATFYDRGWYNYMAQRFIALHPKATAKKYGKGKLPSDEVARQVLTTRRFEEQLVADGYIVLKFFLNVSKSVQKDRLMKMLDDPKMAWKVDDTDLEGVQNYDRRQKLYDVMLEATNYDFAPWILLNGEDRRRSNIQFMQTIVTALENALHAKLAAGEDEAAAKALANSAGLIAPAERDERSRTPEENEAIRKENEKAAKAQHDAAPTKSLFVMDPGRPTLRGCDYNLHLPEGTYKTLLKAEQKRFRELELEMYLKRIALICVYEGSDAGGKGGNYRRAIEAIDAKAYNVFTSPAPTKDELLHPFLWRYAALRVPRAGHVAVYDRSWYGRVLVERVEGFASNEEWGRAYDEINAFEEELVNWGAILLKFWIEIDRDEQLKRFEARESTPEKQWKIVDEDWRNRDKYPQYREAVEDMFRLTSTKTAPWYLIEGNDKEYARIKALRIINDALEKRLHS